MSPSLLITTGNNNLYNRLSKEPILTNFTFVSSQEKRDIAKKFFNEKLSMKTRSDDKIEVERKTSQFLDTMGFDYPALKRFCEGYETSLTSFINQEMSTSRRKLSYLYENQYRRRFLRGLAERMAVN